MDCRGPLKCVKLFNFRLVEITNPSMYVCANNIVSYAKFMDRVARSTDICAIHGFLRRVWIHRLRKQIHGYRRSTDCAQHIHPWHHKWKISNTHNTYFQCYCGSNIGSEMANLEHRLTWKVASLFPQNAHVKSGTKWLPKNALKSLISQKLKMIEQKCKSHNTPHHQSYPMSLVSSL